MVDASDSSMSKSVLALVFLRISKFFNEPQFAAAYTVASEMAPSELLRLVGTSQCLLND